MKKTIEAGIMKRIRENRPGFVFTPSYFYDIGSRAGVAKSLERMTLDGKIRRMGHGIYDYPKKHPKLGNLPASPESVIAAISKKENTNYQPSGAYAANVLGLSEQVPGKIVYLTDGASKEIRFLNYQIIFKKTTPKNMATAGKTSGLVIQALRYIGREKIEENTIETLRNRIPLNERKRMMADIKYAPIWIGKIFRQLVEEG